MRVVIVAVVLSLLSLVGPAPARAGALSDNPVSLGLHLGVVTLGSGAAFALELPFEYTFQAGPGELALHAGFMMTMRDSFFGIVLPIGVRYKLRLLRSHPFYAWPMLDLGPAFETKSGTVGGYLRVGGGLSYLVHPNVEIIFQPLGLGAVFGDVGSAFSYNLMMGANFRF
jgi:hypothetical protein